MTTITAVEVHMLTDAELSATLDQLDRSMRAAEAEQRWRRQQEMEATTQRASEAGGRRRA